MTTNNTRKRISGILAIFTLIALTLGAYAALAETTRTIQYSYDGTDQLTRAVYGNNTTVDYVYDNMGNRLVMDTSLTDLSANSAPYAPHTPFPAHGSINVDLGSMPLSWQCDYDFPRP